LPGLSFKLLIGWKESESQKIKSGNTFFTVGVSHVTKDKMNWKTESFKIDLFLEVMVKSKNKRKRREKREEKRRKREGEEMLPLINQCYHLLLLIKVINTFCV
jgi:ribonuclease PH